MTGYELQRRASAKSAPVERQIHKGIVQLLRLNAAPGVVWWHTANERRCSPREGAFLKSMGVLPGVSDFVLIVPGHGRAGPIPAFIEVKRRNGRLTETQRAFRESVFKIGCYYEVVHSITEAAEELRLLGALRSPDVRAAGER